jgi:FkbM family methyltransferase
MSVVAGGRGGEDEDRRHVACGEALQGVTTYDVEATAATLDALLDRHGMDAPDLLCLDLEGYEPQALRGLDLKRRRPEWIMVEAWDRAEIDRLLLPFYDVAGVLSHHDVLYHRR